MTFDERLIQLIRGKEYLYDRKNEEYRNHELKEIEWNRIAIDLKSTVERCRKRWVTLRDRYKRIKKQRSESGGAKKWKYYDSLSFISGETTPSSQMDSFETDDIIENTVVEIEELEKCPPTPTEVKNDPIELTQYFSSFVEEARNAVSKLPAIEMRAAPDATDEFFHYLAKRVKAANLNTMQEMRMEAAILNFTVEKLNAL